MIIIKMVCPSAVCVDVKAISIGQGGRHKVVLKNDGTLWVASYNNDGQLGDGTSTHRHSFIQAKYQSGSFIEGQ